MEDEQFEARRSFARRQGGRWTYEPEHFGNRSAWVLDPDAAERCMAKFDLTDVEPYEHLAVSYGGWGVAVVACGPDPAPEVCAVTVVDFEAALAAVKTDAARALGLALWLGARGEGRAWYRLPEGAGDLPAGALVSEPLSVAEANGPLTQGWAGRGLRVDRQVAPAPQRAVWAAVPLRGRETPDGLVVAEPHPGCPGHRLGALLPDCLRAGRGREASLRRGEWDQAVERAALLGVAAELAPRPRPAMALAFQPARLPGWDTGAWLGAGVENIDEHMMAALEAKQNHIDEVLGEGSGSLVSPGDAGESALARLVCATRSRLRHGGSS